MAEKNIYHRLIEVQKKVVTVFKNETVKMYEGDKGYKAVTHDDVAKALHVPLAEAGIFMLPDVVDHSTTDFKQTNKYNKEVTWYRTDIKIKVKWINADKPDEFVESNGAAFALDTSDKSFAKAYSLALKIVLLKVHLLESTDDEEKRPYDDANGTNDKDPDVPKQNANKKNQSTQQNKQSQKKELDQTPAPEHLVDKCYGKAMDKNIPETHLYSLLTDGYKVNLDNVPTWAAEKLLAYLSHEKTTAEVVKAQVDLFKKGGANGTQNSPG